MGNKSIGNPKEAETAKIVENSFKEPAPLPNKKLNNRYSDNGEHHSMLTSVVDSILKPSKSIILPNSQANLSLAGKRCEAKKVEYVPVNDQAKTNDDDATFKSLSEKDLDV